MADLNAFRNFLVRARERADPASFPELRDQLEGRDPRGRRGRGLTQAHMDILLRRSAGTYERLERGKTIRPALLEGAGRVLRLSEDEWRALWAYAYSTSPPRPLHPASRALPREWQTTLDTLPPAAYIQDPEGHLLAFNAEFGRYFGDEPVPDNLLRWSLTSPVARTVLLDWRSMWAPALCGQLRAGLAVNRDSRVLNELFADVLADDQVAPLLRAAASTAPQANSPRPVRHPEFGNGWITMCAASPADFPEARLTIAPFHRDPPPLLP
jgi:PAS domain-containing protein